MTELRILTLVSWATVFLFCAPAAWIALFGRNTRYGDPMRLACAGTAIIICGFNARWLLAPDSMFAWQVLYVLSAADAAYILWLVHVYGRGPRV